MDSTLALALMLVAGLLVGVLATWLVCRARSRADAAANESLRAMLAAASAERDWARQRADDVIADRHAQAGEFKAMAHEALTVQQQSVQEATELRLRATEQLLRPVRDGLETFNRRLAEVERDRAAMTADLSAQVQAVRTTGEALRRETASLATALRKPQVRGAWGELQLRRVVEIAGMLEHCDFETQATATTTEDRTIRPDLKVLLAGGRFVYVDSKVPLAAFLDAQESDDERVRAERLAAFGRNVRTHVTQLGGKSYYKADPGTPEFVVLFIPSEALAAEALAQFPELHEFAAQHNVVLATPSTLIALLRAVSYGWRQATLADSAREVFALGRELYDRLGVLGGHFDKIGRSLNAAVTAYNGALGSLESRVLVTGRRLRDLGLTDADLAVPAPADQAARPMTAVELTAAQPPIDPDRASRVELPEAAELRRPEPRTDDLVDRWGAGATLGAVDPLPFDRAEGDAS